MSAFSSEIVIGIDFGTTHSGVSWAVNGGKKSIRLINNWPNPEIRNPNSEKVPSVISYQDGSPFRWGYQVNVNETSFRWFKILLEPESKYAHSVEQVRSSNEQLQKLNKTIVSVVADYLRLLWDYTMKDIEKRQGSDYAEVYAFRVVMSVPAIWSPVAKERTLQAAKQAGLGSDVSLITEPEAAALATLKDRSESSILKEGDCFVVCDAGGGTVDLISYEVLQAEPLRVKECAIGTGDLCGSIFLDIGFQKWITTMIGDSQWARIKDSAKKKMFREFEYAIKRLFDPYATSDYSVELRGVEDDEAKGIRDDTIEVRSTVVKTIFDHVYTQVNRLVADQIQQVKSQSGRNVKAVLLVGGFGESGYLFDNLKHSYASKGIAVLQVDGAWSAICRGATLWGLENSTSLSSTISPHQTVVSRLARYSYGIVLDIPFDEDVHNIADRYWDSTKGEWFAKQQMDWLVKRGETIEDGKIVDSMYYCPLPGIGMFSSGTSAFGQRLLYSDKLPPPVRFSHADVKQLCEITWELEQSKIWATTSSYKKDGVKYRDCHFKVMIRLGNADLVFVVAHGNDLVAGTEAKYPDC